MSCQPSCATCQQLRAAALEVVGNGGIGALCSESLAAQASLPPEEVAAHYPVLASCLHEGYEEEASDLVRTVVEGYEDGADWQSGFERSRADLVEWVSTHPAGARLFFVEAVRGDRELRRRRDRTRRKIVEFFAGEYARSANGNAVPLLQIELLIGAGFQLISGAIGHGEAAQHEMPALEQRLAELDGFFIPVPVQR